MPIIKQPTKAEEFRALIERYKVQNPVKFAMKRPALEAKLAGLLAAENPTPEPKEEETVEEKIDEEEPRGRGRPRR